MEFLRGVAAAWAGAFNAITSYEAGIIVGMLTVILGVPIALSAVYAITELLLSKPSDKATE